MANPPPIVSLAIPVLGWYSVQFGGIQTSQVLSVPNASFLSSPDGINSGLIGVSDGSIAHLAGVSATGDSGSNWIMWVANSLAVADGQTIFNPNPSASTPGRWVAQLPPIATTTRVLVTGAVIALSPDTTLVVIRKTIPSSTTIQLPAMNVANLGPPGITVKADASASSFPVIVNAQDGAKIDAQLSDIINVPYAARTYEADGTVWNKV